MATLSVHRATSIRIPQSSPSNANAIVLEIGSEDGKFDLNLFGLPKHITDKLMLAFADEETYVHGQDE